MSEKNPTPISQNPIPVSPNLTPVSQTPTAVSFSLDRDGIRNRILEIRSKHGCTNSEQFSQLVFGDKSHTKTIDKWTGKDSTTIPTIDSLALIAHSTGVSLDWLVFGKEKTPARNEVKKTDITKDEESNYSLTNHNYALLLQSYGEALDKEETALVESLLDNERPVLQMCASFLYLLSYAKISLIGDYDINNMDTPQSLTIKITPKAFLKHGFFDEDNQKFTSSYDPDTPLLFIWDYRTTLLQRFIALALNQERNLCFDERILLKSAINYMNSDIYLTNNATYSEFSLNGDLAAPKVTNPAGGLSRYSIFDAHNACTATGFNSFDFTDYGIPSLDRIIAHCDADKVPCDIKGSGRFNF